MVYIEMAFFQNLSALNTQHGKPFFEFSDSLLNLVDKSYTNIELIN